MQIFPLFLFNLFYVVKGKGKKVREKKEKVRVDRREIKEKGGFLFLVVGREGGLVSLEKR